MGTTVGQIKLDLGINSSEFKKQLNSIGQTTKTQTGSMALMFGNLGMAIAGAFAIGAVTAFTKAIISAGRVVVDFSKDCIELGSDLSEVQNVVDVTFGSMSYQVNDFAKNAMESFGLSEKVAKQYMGTFGAMSKAFGNTTAKAYEQAAALTGLAGDVASFYNLTTDEAYTKLKSVFTGETESLKDLGVVMTQTALDEYALQKGMGKTTSQMSEQEKVALRLAFVQDRLATASGDFARTSDGWANQTRVLALRFDALRASIGQGLIAALTPVVQLLNKLMVYLQAAADAFSNFMQALFGKKETAMAGAGAALMEGMGAASSASSDLASNSADAAKSANAIKKSLAGFDQVNILRSPTNDGAAGVSGGSSGTSGEVLDYDTTGALSAIDKLREKIDGLKVKLHEFANIAGFTNLWDDFHKGMDNVKAGVDNLWGALKGAAIANIPGFLNLISSIYDAFITVSQTVTTIFGDTWLIITENFKAWTETHLLDVETFFSNWYEIAIAYTTYVADTIADAYGDIGAWWEDGGKPVFDGIVKAIGDVGKWVLDIYNTVIAPIQKKVIEVLREIWEGSARPVFQNFLGLISDVGEAILALWNHHLKPVVSWIIDKFAAPIRDTIMDGVEDVGDAYSSIYDIINSMITLLRGVVRFITNVFSGDWKKAWDEIKGAFGTVWEDMRSAIAPPLNGMLGKIESFINSIIKGINYLIRAINKISIDVPDWVPEFGGKSLGFNLREVSGVNLPRLATGGYVEANSPQLAIIGDNKREGEIVSPESKIAEAVAAGVAAAMRQFTALSNSRSEQRTPVVIKIGESDFWSGFIDYHNDIVKRTGGSPLYT